MACPPELEDSLLWKLPELGIVRIALRHRPEAPAERQLLAWLPEVDWPESERRELERALQPLGEPFQLELPPIHWKRQPDEDWSLSWKQHWQPDPVGQRLLILPAWLELPAEHGDRLVIRMDPGSAFGTGSHPTTRLCLEALEACPPLAALRLGAASVAAADTDSLAERATRTNAALNGDGLPERMRVAQGSVEQLAELLEGQPADLLLCNILAPVIEALCPAFSTVLAPAGMGYLSGLLVDQAPGLIQALAAQGWQAELTAQQDRWGLLTIRRHGNVA
jgi:ribosomal protein L11 methyltransferase